MYTLLQNGQQSATVTIPKPHAHILLSQMKVQEGIKRFSEKGNEALLKELNQPVSREDMLYDKKKKVLQYLTFLKEKRDSSIKARGCADGHLQRDYMTKNETNSFTVYDAIMLLKGMIAELIVKLEPRLYRKYIWKNKNDKPMLYVKVRKALYGTLQAGLLF